MNEQTLHIEEKEDILTDAKGLQGAYAIKDRTTGAVYYVGDCSDIGAVTHYHTSTHKGSLYSAMKEDLGEAEAYERILSEQTYVEIFVTKDKELRKKIASNLIEIHQPEYNLYGSVQAVDVVERYIVPTLAGA